MHTNTLLLWPYHCGAGLEVDATMEKWMLQNDRDGSVITVLITPLGFAAAQVLCP